MPRRRRRRRGAWASQLPGHRWCWRRPRPAAPAARAGFEAWTARACMFRRRARARHVLARLRAENPRAPGAGVHGGATVALPAPMMAQACNANGRDLVTAIVAGVEAMFRIGAATLHSAEKVGFHGPGMTGLFGSATACALLMKLSAAQTANAYGIAGSLAGGLLAFAKSGSGGMIKRLHLGRAAESGVIAARLAQRGYEGPPAVLEGRYGLLEHFARRPIRACSPGAWARPGRSSGSASSATPRTSHRCPGPDAARVRRAARLRR